MAGGAEELEEADCAAAKLDKLAGVVLLWVAGAAVEELGLCVSVTGQMVVYAAMVSVMTVVSVCCSGCAGQSVTVGAQLITVCSWVVKTVEVT